MSVPTPNNPIDPLYAREVLRAEARAVASLEARIGPEFIAAAELILRMDPAGRIVATGMGKAGLIGQKIAATFASTGTPALFMHPAEAVHGDLGMAIRQDVALAVSNSGETEELLRLLPTLKRIGCKIIAISASRESSLGRAADVVLEIGRIEEPCPLRMAPSASTAALLAMGDALALSVLKARGFSREDFARLHPAGSIGRGLLQVVDAMRSGERMVKVAPTETIANVLALMSKAPRNGAAVIAGAAHELLGIFTHGDLARLILEDPRNVTHDIGRHMTSPCQFVRGNALVVDAQNVMHGKRINALPVVDADMKVLGLLDIQDLV